MVIWSIFPCSEDLVCALIGKIQIVMWICCRKIICIFLVPRAIHPESVGNFWMRWADSPKGWAKSEVFRVEYNSDRFWKLTMSLCPSACWQHRGLFLGLSWTSAESGFFILICPQLFGNVCRDTGKLWKVLESKNKNLSFLVFFSGKSRKGL